jgi:hypothetical protein
MRFLALAFAVAVAIAAACAGKPPPSPDAATNLGFGSSCTVVSDTSTECASGVCTNSINMLPTPVCSVKCNPLGTGSDCPVGSMGQKCNMKGYCRP